MKRVINVIFLSILFFLSSCSKEEANDKSQECIYYWRSGDWETNYGYLGSGVFYDAIADETVAFQGVFKAHDRDGGVTFSINPFGDLFTYSFYWAYSFYGNSNCTPDFLISSNYEYSLGIVDLQARWNSEDKIEVSGDYYEYNQENDNYVYQGSIYFISN